jgi:hypothetical protein
MIKCTDKGFFTCISSDGKPKASFDTSDEAINKAKYLNQKYPKKNQKLVGYKCTNCHKYHLTTRFLKNKFAH